MKLGKNLTFLMTFGLAAGMVLTGCNRDANRGAADRDTATTQSADADRPAADRGYADRTAGDQGNKADRQAGEQADKAGRQAGEQGSKAGRQAGEQGKSTVSAAEREFIMKAAKSGMMEVELGRLAQEKGTSEQVKNLGQRLVADHGKANEELKEVASRAGVTLPEHHQGMKHDAKADRLQNLSGAEFDRQFMRMQVEHHRKDIAEFQKMARNGSEPVKSFAAKQLPALQEHLRMAQEYKSDAKSSTADRSGTKK